MPVSQHYVLLQIKESSILVEPDVPVYDLHEVLDKVGFPIEPDAPFFKDLQASHHCPA